MSKILVIDDDLGIRRLCYELFSKDGHVVITEPRGDRAFEMIRSESPDLILLDLILPGEEGLSFLNRMPRHAEGRIPVVIFSGYIEPHVEESAIAAGAIDVISKTIGTKELRRRINKILSSKERVLTDSNSFKSEKIMIVDDEENVRNYLLEFFKRKGYCAILARNGEEALELLQKEHPSMILLDVSMPGMDGLLALKKIRELDPNVGIVMATGIQDEQIAKEATELGAYAYVVKPFDMKYLEMVVLTRLIMAA